VRIGLLGPVGDHTDTLEAIASFCTTVLDVDALYYLGDDNPFVLLPKPGPSPLGELDFWGRAAQLAAAGPTELESFVQTERMRSAVDCVKRFGPELVRRFSSAQGHRWVLCHSSKCLTRDDQDFAHLLAYGNSPEWFVQRSGEQILVAPGPLETAGVMLIDDTGGLHVDVFDKKCTQLVNRRLDFTPTLVPPAL
jgi:hypothetical protein